MQLFTTFVRQIVICINNQPLRDRNNKTITHEKE